MRPDFCSQLRRNVDGQLPVGRHRRKTERTVEGCRRDGSYVSGGSEIGDCDAPSKAEGTGASDARMAQDTEAAGESILMINTLMIHLYVSIKLVHLYHFTNGFVHLMPRGQPR